MHPIEYLELMHVIEVSKASLIYIFSHICKPYLGWPSPRTRNGKQRQTDQSETCSVFDESFQEPNMIS